MQLRLEGLELSVVIVAPMMEVKTDGDDQELLIDRKNGSSYHLVLWLGRLWFSCGTCKRSRISPCISWRFDENRAPPFS